MRISPEGKIGICLGLLGLGGGGAIMVAPEQFWIGWTMIGLAALGEVALLMHHLSGQTRKPKLLVMLGTALILLGGVVGFIGALQEDHAQKSDDLPPEAKILFDFSPAYGLPAATFDSVGHAPFPILEIRSDGGNPRAFITMYSGIPNTPVDWAGILKLGDLSLYKLDVTSLDGQPKFNVDLELKLDFREAVPQKLGMQFDMAFNYIGSKGPLVDGESVSKQTVKIHIRRVDPNAPYTIYGINRSPYFVAAKISTAGTTTEMGGWRPRAVRVTTGTMPWMAFTPAVVP